MCMWFLCIQFNEFLPVFSNTQFLLGIATAWTGEISRKKNQFIFFLNVVFVSITFLFRSIIVEWWCATTHRIKVPLHSDWVVYGLECMFREREGDGWAERSHVSNAWMWLSNQSNETTKNSTNLLILQAFSADVNNTWRN